MPIRSDYHEVRYEYDLGGREIEVSYYDRAGNPMVTRGLARKTTAYNDLGNVTESNYYDTEAT